MAIELSSIPGIETPNYLLRGMELADAGAMYNFMGNKETMRYLTPEPIPSEEEMKNYIMDRLSAFGRKSEIPWVILSKDSGNVIGMFRFHKLHLWHKKTEMGVVISKDFQAKGVMTEILTHILPYGFHTLGLNRIVGDIFAENMGSKKLLEKFGFVKEGQLRQTDFDGERYHDTVVYSLLRSEYMG